MDRKYIKDNQIVDRYLQNKLRDDEVIAFEEFYLSDAETLAELELAEKFQQGMQDCAASGLLEEGKADSWITRTFTSPQYSLAASVLLLCSIGISGLLYQRAPSAPGYTGTQLVPIFATRGTDPAIVKVEAKNAWVVLLADPGVTPYTAYRARIISLDAAGSRDVWQVDGLTPGYDDQLAVGMPAAILLPGDYELRLEGENNARGFAEINRLTFRVP